MSDEMMSLKRDLDAARFTANEFRDKLEAAENRVAQMWDLALWQAQTVLGHPAKCQGMCIKCWVYQELEKLKRQAGGNYIPLKERLRLCASKFLSDIRKKGLSAEAVVLYTTGVIDMMSVIEPLLPDEE